MNLIELNVWNKNIMSANKNGAYGSNVQYLSDKLF